ncbi:MAG: hypothetical protein AUF79_14280 [Crenarchaeota archaeon 13_1_20CM_2_51_8]|nr:MAG: hypothetical protein AUF79_14280 [Crenarchaeota archaeon 13_1_20CM_2_51_8]
MKGLFVNTIEEEHYFAIGLSRVMLHETLHKFIRHERLLQSNDALSDQRPKEPLRELSPGATPEEIASYLLDATSKSAPWDHSDDERLVRTATRTLWQDYHWDLFDREKYLNSKMASEGTL